MVWPWWIKISSEDFTDVTLVNDDSYEDDVKCGDGGGRHVGWQGGRWGDQHGWKFYENGWCWMKLMIMGYDRWNGWTWTKNVWKWINNGCFIYISHLLP